MGLTDWIGSFDRASTHDLSNNLEQAYEAALLIQSLELEYYNDRPVRPELELSIPKSAKALMLRRFRAALQVAQENLADVAPKRAELDSQELRQLQLVESVVSRYGRARSSAPSMSRSPEMLPRSLLGMFDGVRRQLDPEAEASVVAGFRRRRDSTLVSLRVLLLLILVPLVIQQTSRSLLISPLMDRYAPEIPFLNYTKPHLQEKAVAKLRLYQQELEFEALLEGKQPPSPEEIQSALARRANALKDEADAESMEASKNVQADLAALVGFVLVCLFCRRDLQVLRGFLDEAVYGLSDSAKAFAIILFTDIFVGFHSPEGWTVLLDGIAHHLGLPAEENFILLFIATFPVVLATIFKYWIFRYLNRVSPSAVATLKNMNGGG
ncbi:proton extrusion protein PcxA [Synechococcus sp. LTW-R]|uniref:proton extrusion protein PcxA n=1 Tax=Synechococcus sp. LTW-R TaxID=2751170 RepID=UPI0016298A83|nr:proton extrusion protein PcxA [Synechococcus sp. LTW-R]QNG30200.1 proton extrusion protein PcxA [Synechococcus sp. LTW-R]